MQQVQIDLLFTNVSMISSGQILPFHSHLKNNVPVVCFCRPTDGLICSNCYSKRVNEVRSQVMLWSTLVGTTISSQVATVQQICGHLCSDISLSSLSGLETLEMSVAQMAVSTSHLHRKQIHMLGNLETSAPSKMSATTQQVSFYIPSDTHTLPRQSNSDSNFDSSNSISAIPNISNTNIDVRSFPCPDPDVRCGERFPTEAHASLHYRRIHKSGLADIMRQYACTHCTASYAQQRFLDRHLRVGHTTRNVTADTTPQEVSSLLKRNHAFANNNTPTDTLVLFPCRDPRCPFSTTTACNQIIHINKMHCEPRQKFRCHLCSASCNHQIGLRHHLLIHQSARNVGRAAAGESDYVRPLAKRGRPPRPALASEQLPYVLLPQSQHHTAKCDSDINVGVSSFMSTTQFTESTNTNIEVSSFHCPDPDGRCGERFPTEAHASLHYRRMHSTGQADTMRQYACTHCTASYAQQRFLQRHLRVGHKDLNNNQIIGQQSLLLTASAIPHEYSSLSKGTRVFSNTTSTIPFLFPCRDPRCPYSTTSSQYQLLHFDTVHHQPRHQFRCSLCSASYHRAERLNQHLVRHNLSTSGGFGVSETASGPVKLIAKRGRWPKPVLVAPPNVMQINASTSSLRSETAAMLLMSFASAQSMSSSVSELNINAHTALKSARSAGPKHMVRCRVWQCPLRFSSKSREILHHSTVHAQPRKHYCCLECSASFDLSRLVTSHRLKHRELRTKATDTPSAVKPRLSKSGVEFVHESGVDNSESILDEVDIAPTRSISLRPYKCRVATCPETFVANSGELYHQQGHTQNYAHKCVQCGASYKKHAPLANHLLKHAIQKTKCNTNLNAPITACDSTTNVIDTELIDTDHIETTLVSSFPCHFSSCPEYYNSSRAERNHNVQNHKRHNIYACTQCSASYGSAKWLNMHMRKHSESLKSQTKLHRCHVLKCPETFDSSIAADLHLEVHSAPDGYHRCVHCSAAYDLPVLLDMHMLKHAVQFSNGVIDSSSLVSPLLPTMHVAAITATDQEYSLKYSNLDASEHALNSAHEDTKKHAMRASITTDVTTSSSADDTHSNAIETDSIDTGTSHLFACRVVKCPEYYTSAQLERIHNEQHHKCHNINTCAQCGASYAGAKGLSWHMRKHVELSRLVTSTTMYPCHSPMCPETFVSTVVAYLHYLEVHSAPDHYHRCAYCTAAYASLVSLDKHLARHGIKFDDGVTTTTSQCF